MGYAALVQLHQCKLNIATGKYFGTKFNFYTSLAYMITKNGNNLQHLTQNSPCAHARIRPV